MNKTGPRDDASLAAIRLEWWPRSNWNWWPPSSESAAVSAAINIFLRKFGDENASRNITERDRFHGVSRQI